VSVEVHLVTPEREVWTGTAEMVVAAGVDGHVGILGGHAPLLIQLAIAPLKWQLADGNWSYAVVDGGFMHVSTEAGATRVDILASYAELASEIDSAAARSLKEEAEQRIRSGDDASARAELAKATARLELAG
jgi:F-type H+-transporting ATPase subunit epsilon